MKHCVLDRKSHTETTQYALKLRVSVNKIDKNKQNQ